MDFELKILPRNRLCTEKTDALLFLIPEQFSAGPDPLSQLITQALQLGDLTSKPGRLLSSYRAAGVAATRVLYIGVGQGTARQVRTAIQTGLNTLKGSNAQRVVVFLGALDNLQAEHLQAAVLAGSDAAYRYTTTPSPSTLDSKDSLARLKQMTLAVADAASLRAVQSGFVKGQALEKGIALAKEWANRPANHATPTLLAGAAKALAKLPGISVQVLGPTEVQALGMGAFMAVAQGTVEPLRFIVLRYQGGTKAAGKDPAPVVLVGKGITFDSGGISIKPAADMDEMKFDMCGAASVLGVFRALAELQPALSVVGLIPACENMPSGSAVKPGDVVTSMSGQTIEIINTDAEGRLVLCDALTYAERFKPRAVVDIATLTGACVVALGAVRSGLFSSNDGLANALQAAGEAAHDLCWRMPLDDDYAEGLKTHFADVANVAGRAAGAVTAAKFLQRFTQRFAWAHLDIAGTAWKSGSAKGATGRPVALLVEYLLGQAMPLSAKTNSKASSKASRAAKTQAARSARKKAVS